MPNESDAIKTPKATRSINFKYFGLMLNPYVKSVNNSLIDY